MKCKPAGREFCRQRTVHPVQRAPDAEQVCQHAHELSLFRCYLHAGKAHPREGVSRAGHRHDALGRYPLDRGEVLGVRLYHALREAVVIAQVMLPPQGEEVEERFELTRLYRSGLDALTTGTIDGLRLLAYIIGMLIVLIALVELANIVLALVPDVAGGPLTLQRMLGWVLAPLAWALGIPWSEATTAGQVLGIKVVLNELVAYLRMAELPAGSLSERSALIMAYSICGFANFGSIGIMVGGIGAIVPERRLEIAQLGLKSIVAGTMATCMTGAVIGLLHW